MTYRIQRSGKDVGVTFDTQAAAQPAITQLGWKDARPVLAEPARATAAGGRA